MFRALFLCALAPSAAAMVSPQVDPIHRRGPFSADSFSLSLAAGDELISKNVGDQAPGAIGLPVLPLDYTGAVFSLSSLFPGHESIIEIDAMSSGNDLISFSPNGVALEGSDRWGALILSVDSAAQGTPGGWIDGRVLSGFSPSADLISYVLDNSSPTGIAPVLIGRSFIEQSFEHLGLQDGDEIDALDWFMPSIMFDESQFNDPLFLFQASVYVSLTAQSAAALEAQDQTYFGPGAVFSGAAIYRMDWAPETGWVNARMHRSPFDLGFTTLADDPTNREIDALAVNEEDGSIVFSTDPATDPPNTPQLQVQVAAGQVPVPVTVNAAGKTVQDGSGIRLEDNIDAICAIDPHDNHTSSWVSTPRTGTSSNSIGLSIARGQSPSGDPTLLHMQVTGWGTTLDRQSAGLVQILVYLDSVPTPFTPLGPLTPLTPLMKLPRAPQQETVSFETLVLPPGPLVVNGAGQLIGMRAAVQAVAYDSSLAVSQSNLVEIRL